MKVMFDLFTDSPSLILSFEDFDDLCCFLVGFLEAIDE